MEVEASINVTIQDKTFTLTLLEARELMSKLKAVVPPETRTEPYREYENLKEWFDPAGSTWGKNFDKRS